MGEALTSPTAVTPDGGARRDYSAGSIWRASSHHQQFARDKIDNQTGCDQLANHQSQMLRRRHI
jgi:hypothetical protein